jgi:hypothetical protein
MFSGKLKDLARMLRRKSLTLALLFLVFETWPWPLARAQSIPVSWFRFDPIAVRPDRTEPVVYKALINGNPSSVQFVLAAGGTVPLSNEGGGVWSVTLTAQQVLFGYLPENANHNFVGFLDIFQGGTFVRINEFIGVVDENVFDIGGEIQNLGDMLRISPHVVNVWSPNRTPGVPSDAEIRSITQQFYQVFHDEYDFLNLVFALPSSNNNRFHFDVKNEVDGIGLSRFNNTAVYGSNGRLQGINVFPIDTFFDMAATGALHETGHQWINFLTLPILHSGSPHWPVSSLARGIMGFNIPGSLEGGNFHYNLVPLPNGNYRLEQTPALDEFIDLDLYLMGLLPASQVGSHIVFANQSQQICDGCILSGPVVTVTVDDVIAAQGPRRPDVSTSQKAFRVATIIVTKERPLNDDELALFDYFAARGESTVPLPFSSGFEKGTAKPFYLATRGLGSLNTQLTLSTLLSAVLPSSRSVQVGATATAFATVINAGSAPALACEISPLTSLPVSFSYQATNPATNAVTGSPNTAVDIPAGSAQSFVLALTPTAPIAPTDVRLSFDCANTTAAPINSGLNTLLFSASTTPIPDIVALAATLNNDGIVNVPGTTGTGAFAVATVNVGAGSDITASADTGNATLPVNISLCQTDPATGQCISAIGFVVTTTINTNATPTFGIFVQGNGNVPFDPADNRIFVRFKDGGGVTRGSTSVAVRTQ